VNIRPPRLLFALLLVFLAYGLGLAAFSRAGFPRDLQDGGVIPYLSDKPVGEDGYYMLTVAWNLAAGRGLVYNGDLPTTGVQPLATVLYAAPAWVVQALGGDRWTFVRAVLALGALTLVLYGHLAGLIARVLAGDERDLAYALGFAGSVFNFALFGWFTYGLETGVYVTLLACCILYTLRWSPAQPAWRDVLAFGVLAGVTAWARIDFGVVLGVFVVAALVRRQLSFAQAGAIAAIALLAIGPWFVYSYAATGSWLPSSGSSQFGLVSAADALSRAWSLAKALLGHLAPWFYITRTAAEWMALASALSLCVWLGLVVRPPVVAAVRGAVRQRPHVANWLFAAGVLVLVYAVFFKAEHFYLRYTAPVLPALTPLMAAAAAVRLRARPRLATAALRGLAVCFFVWAGVVLHAGRIADTHAISAGFVQAGFPAARIGAFQSGVIGYFNPNVINLDGKVNQAALDALKARRLDRYLDDQNIAVLIDWPSYVYTYIDRDYLSAHWTACAAPPANGVSICLQRRTP
jgi:hypothetical protein